MKYAKVSIFRADALRCYRRGEEESVLPRLVTPVVSCLWLLHGLLLAVGLSAWFAHVPVYAPASVVVVRGDGRLQDIDNDVRVIAFVPPEHLAHLQVGQTLLVQFNGARTRIRRSIIAVEPQISSPDAARERFALSAGASLAINEPSAVAIAQWEPIETGVSPAAYVGRVYRAKVVVSSRRVISLVPLIGKVFEE